MTRSPLVYQAEFGIFEQPDLSRSFRKQFGIDCSLEVRVAGYSADGKIVIETMPVTPEEEEVLAIPSCSRKKSQVGADHLERNAYAIPRKSQVVRNAKLEAQPEK